ncbi:MAG: PorT family protein [Bacteroidia bacterium]
MRSIILILSLSLLASANFAQESGRDYKLGIKTALNFSSLIGTELQNPAPRFGYTAGAYFRTELNKNWGFQAEVLGNFKGSNFNNGEGEYQSIATFYLDFPLLLAYNIKSEKHQILIGPQVGYLGLSSMYLAKNSKAYINGLGLHPFALDGVLAYQQIGKTVGWQVGAKLGILDINNGLHFENVKPETNTNGSIRSLSFEIGLLF